MVRGWNSRSGWWGVLATCLCLLARVEGYAHVKRLTWGEETKQAGLLVNTEMESQAWEFDTGANLIVVITAESWTNEFPNMLLSLFTWEDWNDIDQNDRPQSENAVAVCLHRRSQMRYPFSFSGQALQGSIRLNYTIRARNKMAFVVSICEAVPPMANISLRVAYQFINPGNQHLSLDQLPYMPMYQGMMVWLGCLLGVLTVIHSMAFPPQMLILVGLFSKLTELIFRLVFWYCISADGRVSARMVAVKNVVVIVSDILLLLNLALPSAGWANLRRSPKVLRLLLGVFGLYTLSSFISQFANNDRLRIFTALFAFLLRMIINVGVLVTINQQMEKVKEAMAYDSIWADFQSTAQHLVIRSLKRIRFVFIAHFLLPLLVIFIQKLVLLYWDYSWVEGLATQGADLWVYSTLVFTIRPEYGFR